MRQILLVQVIHSLSEHDKQAQLCVCGLQIPHCFNFIWCYLMQICYVVCLWCVFSFTYVMNFIVIIDLNTLLFSCAYAMSKILISVQSALIFK